MFRNDPQGQVFESDDPAPDLRSSLVTLELMSLGEVHGQTIRPEDLSGTVWARIRDLDTGEIRQIPINIADGPGVR